VKPMTLKFIADENVPLQVVEHLREADYEVVTLGEVAHPGMRNNELAKLSIQLEAFIITRDADFTHLRRSLAEKLKVVYIRLGGDPNSIAQRVLDNIEKCINILQKHNVAVLNKDGCHIL